MSIEALIFDCDGTLADTMPAHYLSWQATLEPLGIEFGEDRFYALGGKPSRNIVSILAEEYGIMLDAEEIARQKEANFLKNLDKIAQISPVTQIVQEHHGKLPLAVATGAVRLVLTKILQQINLTGLFDAEVTAEDTKLHKPEPDVFLEAAQRLGVSPEKCRVYEDSDPGLESKLHVERACNTSIFVSFLLLDELLLASPANSRPQRVLKKCQNSMFFIPAKSYT